MAKQIVQCKNMGGENELVRCKGQSDHKGDCIFEDGTEQLEGAEAGGMKVELSGDLEGRGIFVMSFKRIEKLGLFQKAKAHTLIGYDAESIKVVKSPHVGAGIGIMHATDALRRAGCTVAFGVGLMRVSLEA